MGSIFYVAKAGLYSAPLLFQFSVTLHIKCISCSGVTKDLGSRCFRKQDMLVIVALSLRVSLKCLVRPDSTHHDYCSTVKHKNKLSAVASGFKTYVSVPN